MFYNLCYDSSIGLMLPSKGAPKAFMQSCVIFLEMLVLVMCLFQYL